MFLTHDIKLSQSIIIKILNIEYVVYIISYFGK